VILVLKIGTSTIAREQGLDGRFLLALASVLGALVDAGHKVVLVTSGAVGAGRARMGLGRPADLATKQAAAAVGQGLLMHAYESLLAPLGLATAQLLLTRADLDDRKRYLNARGTLARLLAFDPPVVPIVNENDSIATDELRYGDNDTLSAHVAGLVDADHLVILTDIDGLYDRHPDQPGARLVPEVPRITPEIEAMAGGAGSALGTGGMATKVQAARIATSAGIPMTLMHGRHVRTLLDLVVGKHPHGTRFLAPEGRQASRRRWLASADGRAGLLILDDGAVAAVRDRGKSLLAAGIRSVEGSFAAGAVVRMADARGRIIGHGLANYGDGDMRRIAGHPAEAIEGLLGFVTTEAAVHRNDMVLFDSQEGQG